MVRTTSLSWDEYERFLKGWGERYLAKADYWRIDGRPVIAVNNLYDFTEKYGQTLFEVMLRYGARRIANHIGAAPYLVGVIGEANDTNLRLAAKLPLNGVTGYGLLPNWLGQPVQEYADLIEQRTAEWEVMQRNLKIPFYPVICAGWDATVRGHFRGVLRTEYGYPYSPVVVGVTPQLFAKFLDCAIAFNQRFHPRQNIIFLHAWNEWTEASVLEPSDRFGSALLDEVRKRTTGALDNLPLLDLARIG